MTPRILRPTLLLTVLLILLLGGLTSCGLGRMATGVVVWAPEGSSVHNGDVVWIWEQSRIRKSFKIERPEGGARPLSPRTA